MTEPQLGAIGVVRTGGVVGGLIRWACTSTVNHAVVHVGGGQIVEARWGGARLSAWDSYGDAMTWIDTPAQRTATGLVELPGLDIARPRIADAAWSLLGRRYNALDFAAIAMAQKRLRGGEATEFVAAPPWWARRVSSRKNLICSQLVDLAYSMGGVALFADGRLPGLVSPQDLKQLAPVTS